MYFGNTIRSHCLIPYILCNSIIIIYDYIVILHKPAEILNALKFYRYNFMVSKIDESMYELCVPTLYTIQH